MSVERVLAALEEYFSIKRDIGAATGEPNVVAAKDRAGRALNEYIQSRFDNLLLEDRVRTEHITTKVAVPDVDAIKFSWEDIVGLIDALNSPPNPPTLKQLSSIDFVQRWFGIYKSWYLNKRFEALRTISPPQKLELDLDD